MRRKSYSQNAHGRAVCCPGGGLLGGCIGANRSTKAGPFTRIYVNGVRFSGSLILGVAMRDAADCDRQPLQRLPEGCARAVDVFTCTCIYIYIHAIDCTRTYALARDKI